MTYTEGLLGDGAAILKDGVIVPIEEVVSRLNDMDRYRESLERIADWEDNGISIIEAGNEAYDALNP